MWESLSIDSKKALQNLLFPEGIYYNHENNQVRTSRVNSFFRDFDLVFLEFFTKKKPLNLSI